MGLEIPQYAVPETVSAWAEVAAEKRATARDEVMQSARRWDFTVRGLKWCQILDCTAPFLEHACCQCLHFQQVGIFYLSC